VCEIHPVSPENTVELIAFVREPYGRCTNTQQIHGFTECIGKCGSHTVYNSSKSCSITFLLPYNVSTFYQIVAVMEDSEIPQQKYQSMKVYFNKNYNAIHKLSEVLVKLTLS
jgi:hypothetical protein